MNEELEKTKSELAEAMINAMKLLLADSKEKEAPAKKASRKAKEARGKAPDPEKKSETEAVKEKIYTKEEIRAALATKAKEGYRNEIRTLVNNYAENFSAVDPKDYPEIMEALINWDFPQEDR